MIKEIQKRWKAESPDFFNKLGNIFTTIGVISAGIIAIPTAPILLTTIATYGLTIGGIGKIITKLTVKDTEQKDN